MSDRSNVALGEVTQQIRDAITPTTGTEYNLLGLRMYGGGVYLRETVTTENSKAKTLYRARAGQFIYNRMFAWGGTFGVIPPDLDGSFVSNEFPIFVCDQDRLLVDYLRLHFQQSAIWKQIDEVSTGTTKSRNRWKESQFAQHKLDLPPVPEQRRIVDLMASVDTHAQILREERAAANDALDRTSTVLLSALPTTARLGEMTLTRSGPSYAASDVSDSMVEGANPVIGIPNTRPDGSIDLRDIGYVSGLASSVAKVDDSSLILIRTNGNRQRIGNVYLPPAEACGHAVSAFQFLMKVTVPQDREFIFWTLREPDMQARMSEAASGTTGLGNLAAKWLSGADIPWSDDPLQRASVCRILRAQQDVVDALSAEVSEMGRVRSVLLSALLSGASHIPPSYDSLLREVA